MTGTANQIEFAQQIKANVATEFDRVAAAIETAAGDRLRISGVMAILEDKRTEMLGRNEAGYFIVEWQELRDQVRQLICQDPRYLALRIQKAAPAESAVN